MKKIITIAFLILPLCLFAQLHGNYTIGEGGNYKTFTDAATALNNYGVSAPVIFNVISGTYNEHFVIDYIPNASESNTITFQSQSGDSNEVIVQYAANNTDSNYVVKLKGCSYVTLQNMTFKALGGSQSIVIRIENYAINCGIKNNSLSGHYDTNNQSEALIYSQFDQIENLKIQNNRFSNGSYGIFFNCNSGDAYNESPEITHNTFDSLGYCAAWLSKATFPVFSHNSISGSYFGLDLEEISSACSVYNNKLQDISGTGMTFRNCTATEEQQSYVSNNFIAENMDGRNGMEVKSCSYMIIYNNSIQLLNDYYLDKVLHVVGNSGNNVRIINNNLITMNNGTAIYVEYPDVVTQCDYNNYYSPGRFLAYWGTDCEDLRTLKKLSATNEHSISAYPYFVSDSDLHARSAWLDGAGTDVGLMDDIDGEARNNPPDIGADEFTAQADVQPPLSGTRTIGRDYESLNEAINDIRIKGLSDSLILKYLPGTYDEQCVIPPIPGASSAHPLIIESSTGNTNDVVLQYDAENNDDNYVLYLKGSSFLKLRHLTFNGLDQYYCRILKMDGMVDSLFVESCQLNGTLQGGGAWERAALIDGYDVNFHHQSILNNTFQMGAYAIYLNNYFDMSYPGKIRIENNNGEEVDYQSVYLSQIRFPVIKNNHLESHTYGMKIQQADVGLKIEKNYILAPNGEGIHLFQCQLNSNSDRMIDNNFVMSNGDNANLSAMEIGYCDTLSIYYNSVSTQINSTNDHSLYIHNSNGLDLKDNIFSNKGTGYAVYVSASDFSGADYNCYYSQGQNLGYWDQVCANLDAIRTASSDNAHSIQANPVFAADDDLHASSGFLEGAAIPISGIDFDFDGDQRHPTTPDIGADEFYSGTQNPPYRIAQIGDQVFPEDCGTQTIVDNLHTIFEDDAWDYLTFSATSTSSSIVPVVHDSTLSLLVADNFNGENIPVYVNAVDLAHQAAHDTFLVTITPVPDKPIAVDDHVSILSGNNIEIYPLKNDSDPDGGHISISSIGTAQHGTSTIMNDSTLNYDPQTGFLGADSFKYVIHNDDQLYDTAFVYVEVTEIFSLADSNFSGVSNGGALWGDFDNDKDLDLLVFGAINNQNENVNVIYQNDGGIFTVKSYLTGSALMPDNPQGAAWGDVDNDGDLDLMIAGKVSADPSTISTRLYVNNQGNFTLYQTGIFNSWATSITWVDYDNDGDQDVFISGNKSSESFDPLTKLYRNDGKGEGASWIFTDVTANQFPDVSFASAAWTDYDHDGDQDLLFCGSEGMSTTMMGLFYNDNGSFTSLDIALTNLNYGRVVWGDYDNDGDMDILFSGRSTDIFSPRCGIYRNDDNDIFTLINLPGTSIGGDAAWVDYDNDGDLDIALCGRDSLAGKRFQLYNNDQGNYTPIETSIPGVTGGMAWGDYNNDGKIDLCYTGMDQSGQRNTVLMRNNCINTNLPPEAPSFAGHSSYYHSVGLMWHAPHDDHTPSQSLTYNIMVGEVRDGVDVVSPNSHPDNGFRKIVAIGNVGSDTSYTITGLVSGKLYWFAVQAVDGAYAGSPFYTRGEAAYADDFMEIAHSLPDIAGKLATADINKDKKIDVMMYGKSAEDSYVSRVFKKETADFSQTDYTARTASDGSVEWLDFDGDNDPDLLITGFDHSSNEYYITKIAAFQNEQFEEKPYELFGVFQGDARWGDYDNDGDEDVLIMGKQASTPATILYENRDSLFQEVETSFSGFYNGSVDWGDYDNDGDLDVLITGACDDGPSFYASKIYRNDNLVFHEAESDLIPVKFGKGIWGDYDSDGDLDILLCGESFVDGIWTSVTRIYDNNSGEFTAINDTLIGLQKGSIKWVDLDNDGFLDIIGNGLSGDVTGSNAGTYPVSMCYLFKPAFPASGGHYKYLDTWLGMFSEGDIAIGDIDGDKDIDLIQCGYDDNYDYKTRVFANKVQEVNNPPIAPANLTVTKTDSSYIFQWDKASDDKTPQPGLTYNLRLGTAPGSSDIKPCNSDTTGYHFVPVFGNVGHLTSWELKNPPQSGSIYWTVQTIDNNFTGSPFAKEQHIEITGIKGQKEVIPARFALDQNYPNPFNPSTNIRYQLAENTRVEIIIYNILGERVKTLVKQKQAAGKYSIRFDASTLSSGVYFYKLKTRHYTRVRKMVFIR